MNAEPVDMSTIPRKENQKPVQSQEYPLRIWITSGSVPDVNLEKTSSKNTFKYL